MPDGLYIITEEKLKAAIGAISAAGILLGTPENGTLATTRKMLENIHSCTLQTIPRDTLIEELCKREGVKFNTVIPNDNGTEYWITEPHTIILIPRSP